MLNSAPGMPHRPGHTQEHVANANVIHSECHWGKRLRTSFWTTGSQTFNSGIALTPIISLKKWWGGGAQTLTVSVFQGLII